MLWNHQQIALEWFQASSARGSHILLEIRLLLQDEDWSQLTWGETWIPTEHCQFVTWELAHQTELEWEKKRLEILFLNSHCVLTISHRLTISIRVWWPLSKVWPFPKQIKHNTKVSKRSVPKKLFQWISSFYLGKSIFENNSWKKTDEICCDNSQIQCSSFVVECHQFFVHVSTRAWNPPDRWQDSPITPKVQHGYRGNTWRKDRKHKKNAFLVPGLPPLVMNQGASLLRFDLVSASTFGVRTEAMLVLHAVRSQLDDCAMSL